MSKVFWSDYSPKLTIGGAAADGMPVYFNTSISNVVSIDGHLLANSATYYYGNTSGSSTIIPVTLSPTSNYQSITITTKLKNDNNTYTNEASTNFSVKKAASAITSSISGSATSVNTGSTVKVNLSGFGYLNTISKSSWSVTYEPSISGLSVSYSDISSSNKQYTVTIPSIIGASSKIVTVTATFPSGTVANVAKTSKQQITIHQLATAVSLTLSSSSIYASQTTSASASFTGATPYDKSFKWSLVTSTGSPDSTHATLSSTSGSTVTIRAKAAGDVYVKVTSGDNKVSKSAKLTIKALSSASITPSTKVLNPNGSVLLTGNGFNATPSWSANGTSVTLSATSGTTTTVTASSSSTGATTITASNSLGQSASAKITVQNITLSID